MSLQLNAVRKDSLLAIIFANFCTRKRKDLANAHWAEICKEVNFGDIAQFTSKAKINVFFYIQLQRH